MGRAEKDKDAAALERDRRLAEAGPGVVEAVRLAQAAAVKEFRAESGAVGQLPLLELGEPEEFLEVEDDEDGGKRAPGRPKGSRNKRTEDFIGYLRSRYRSPLEGLAVTWSRPVLQLAAELNCTLQEAHGLQLEAMRAALPYWEQRLPIKLDIDAAGLPTIITMDPMALLALLNALPENDPARAGIEFLAPLLEHQPGEDEGEGNQ